MKQCLGKVTVFREPGASDDEKESSLLTDQALWNNTL